MTPNEPNETETETETGEESERIVEPDDHEAGDKPDETEQAGNGGDS